MDKPRQQLPQISRRQVMATVAAGVLAARCAGAEQAPADRPSPLCLFSKCLASRKWDRLPGRLAELGFSHVDLTVRPGGHVAPERVADELPRAQEALRQAGVRIAMITTEITSVDQPHTQAIVQTAARLGIGFLKLGYYRYASDASVHRTWAEARARLRELVPLLESHKVHAGFHNHSGMNVGSLLWDEWELLRDLDPRWIGSYFDPCHAAIEGAGNGWQIGLNLLASRVTMLAVKDFVWQRRGREWRPQFGPLAEGSVRWPDVLATLRKAGFAGPISLHIEYGPRGEPGSQEDRLQAALIRKDLAFLREALAEAGIPTR